MSMLLAFVLFGVVLSGILPTVSVVPALILAGLVVFVIRPAILGAVLARARMSWEAHAFVAWFGPRGLNSLLLALLVVQAGIPGGELLLATVGVVVLASVVIHGATASPAAAWYARRAAREVLVEEREGSALGLFAEEDEEEIPRITPEQLHQMMSELSPVVLDVRSRMSYDSEQAHIPGDIRVLPDEVIEWAENQDRNRPIVAYCS